MVSSQSNFCNYDGSFPEHTLKILRARGNSEADIKRMEEVSILHTRIDRENALARKKHNEYCEEQSRRVAAELEAKRLEREKLGIEPTFKILYSSKDRVDINSMSPAKRRTFEMRGLDREELLSQGYIGLDDLDNSGEIDEEESNFSELSDADDSPPEIPF